VSTNKLPHSAPGRNRSARGATKQSTKTADRNDRLATDDSVDERLQLVNDRQRGPIHDVSLPEAAVTSLHGILLDFDPHRLRAAVAPKAVRKNPKEFWKRVVRPWLQRYPLFAKARIVSSGRGLHVIIRLEPAVVFETEADRQRWAAIVKIVQRLLPTDPDCPGITALTRPVGSVNVKNGETVRLFRKGEGVNPAEVLELAQEAAARPFATVMSLLYPEKRVSPCPVCEGDGTRLDVLDHAGKCYGSCGTVRLAQIFDLFLKPRAAKKEDA
jgi:hypothetical protein